MTVMNYMRQFSDGLCILSKGARTAGVCSIDTTERCASCEKEDGQMCFVIPVYQHSRVRHGFFEGSISEIVDTCDQKTYNSEFFVASNTDTLHYRQDTLTKYSTQPSGPFPDV